VYGNEIQVTGDLSDALHEVGSKFRNAVDGLSGDIRPDGIDPRTHAALGYSHAATQKALDHGTKVSDKGCKLTKDAKDKAHESAEDIDGVDAKTELSSGHVLDAVPAGLPAPAVAPQQPVWGTVAPQQAMPAGMGGGGSSGGLGSGRGIPFPNFFGGTRSAGSDQSGYGASEAAYTRAQGPSVFQNFDAQQMKNAKEIVNAGLRRGMNRDDIQTALMTAIAESEIKRLANPAVPESLMIDNDGEGHDHDSTGPFQQRQSWGETADLMNPATSADKFYDALLKIPNRDQMDLGAVAQAVQQSGRPGAYTKHEQQAGQLLDAIFAS
jgi:hypothetical protein